MGGPACFLRHGAGRAGGQGFQGKSQFVDVSKTEPCLNKQVPCRKEADREVGQEALIPIASLSSALALVQSHCQEVVEE